MAARTSMTVLSKKLRPSPRKARRRHFALAGMPALVVVVVVALVGLPARTVLAGSAIMVAGQPFEVGRPVVLWHEAEGFDGYAQQCLEDKAKSTSVCCQRRFNRFSSRARLPARTLPALQSIVRQVVLHFDGCVNSRSCFYSMHDMPRPDGGCGLSAHFMIDADGTIYQTLDLLESAYHAKESNGISVGIEICNRGDADRHELDRLPRDYRTRPVKRVVINGHSHLAYDFRPEQYDSVLALVRLLVRVFPGVKPQYPEIDGHTLMARLPNPQGFSGIVGHMHVDRDRGKWDPGAFDWVRLQQVLRGFHFPLSLRGLTFMPQEPEELRRAASVYVRNSEERASGFFPVGAAGTWHSGVHLRGVAGQPVFAPVRGRVIAARFSEHSGSSTSFVLIRHDVDTREGKITFFSLLAHLGQPALSDRSDVAWIREAAQRPETLVALRAGHTVEVDIPVEAGDVVGQVGWVRNGPEWGPELHVETFTAEKLGGIFARTFRLIPAAADGLFVGTQSIVAEIDGNGDGRIAPEEVRHFFREGEPTRRQALRQLVVLHTHEWSDRLSRPEEAGPHFRSSAARKGVSDLWKRAIAPYVFWTEGLARGAGFPDSPTIYSYHPITFLATLAGVAQGDREVHWPPRAPLDTEPGAPLAAGTVGEWHTVREATDETVPIFGPLVNTQATVRKKNDIPLIVLP